MDGATRWPCRSRTLTTGSETLVLLDADTWVAPDGLGRIVSEHQQCAPDGLLSVQPHLQTEQPYEQLSAFCNIVTMIGSGAFASREDATTRPMAFGPCLVTTTPPTGKPVATGPSLARSLGTSRSPAATSPQASPCGAGPEGRPSRCVSTVRGSGASSMVGPRA